MHRFLIKLAGKFRTYEQDELLPAIYCIFFNAIFYEYICTGNQHNDTG